MKPENNKNTRKTILLIVGAILLVVILAIATTFLLKNINTTTNQASQDQETIKQADTEYDKAQKALATGDLPTAKTSLEKAKELYKQTNEKSHLKEIDAALSLIDHTDPQTTPTQQAPPASISASDLKK
jgi:outer membrane protein assembly factor BamD (BamD/ComL family)